MGNATSYAYDKSNRLTKETDALKHNVTKLRLLHDKNIIKKVGDLFLQPFLHFKGNTNRQIHICLKNI